MKKIVLYLIILGAVSFSGCKKFVDINKNPNAPTGTVDEQLLLPTNIVRYAQSRPTYSLYGEELVGYVVNAGGVSGWGTIIDYNYGPGTYAGFWDLYDIITDMNAIVKRADEDPTYLYYGGAAKVLKAMIFQQLVDTYNNIPYTDANKGTGSLTPKYDKAEDIYLSIYGLVDEAIKNFQDGKASSSTLAITGVRDPLFKGDVASWLKLANTVKLRIYLRAKSKVNFPNTTFTSDGFLTSDAIVQPDFVNEAGKQNPTWSRVYTSANALVGGGLQQRVPSFYTIGFYNGNKLTDKFRGNLVYKSFPTPGLNQLGFDPGTDANARVKAPNDWFIGSGTPSATNYFGVGIFKGPDAGEPILTAAESYFLQAEGTLIGVVSGNTKDLFEKGITASFTYLNKAKNNSLASSLFVNKTNGKLATAAGTDLITINEAAITTEVATYKTDNANSYLVNFDLATTNEQKLEAIITQKYLANNMICGGESWNEFRRTGYPTTTMPSVANKYTSFVSLQSLSPSANKLPGRLQYPTNEFQYNAANVNQQKGAAANGGIAPMEDKIFWAK